MAVSVIPFSSAITQLGLGYDTTNGQVKGSLFEEDIETETVVFHTDKLNEDGAENTAVQYKMKLIESRADLQEKMDISGSFEAKKGKISGSVSGSFVDQLIDTKNNVYFLVSVEVSHSVTAITGIPAIDVQKVPGYPGVNSLSESVFFNRYGDAYVGAIEIGGRLDGLVEISASSSQDILDIKADVSLELEGLASGEVSVDYVVSKLTSQRQARVTANGVGGGIGFSPMDPRSFVQLARTFPIMVNGGDGKTVEYKIETNDEGEPVQTATETSVSFAGCAVPVRAVIRSYKSIPIFSYAPPELARLTTYITEDLIEYYLGQDSAKGTINDLMENATGDFNPDDLQALNTIRGNVRVEQSQLLSAIAEATGTNDSEAAKKASEVLKSRNPGELYLLQANEIAKLPSQRAEEVERQKLAQQRNIETLKVEARQRFIEYSTKSIDLGGSKVFSDDKLVIRTHNRANTLTSAVGSNKYIFKMPDGVRTLWELRQSTTVDDDDRTKLYEDASALLRQEYLDLFRNKLARGEINGDEYFARSSALDQVSEYSFWDWAMSADEMWTGELGKLAETNRHMVLAKDGDESFYVEVVDETRNVIRIRNEQNLYWRLSLQFLRDAVLTLEPIGDEPDDESFLFVLKVVNPQSPPLVAIEPENGAMDLHLVNNVLNGRGLNLDDVITASTGSVTESGTFEITVVNG